MLDNVEHLLEGQIYGPESLVNRGNDIFASLHGGEVVKITGDHITHVAKFGKPCGMCTLSKQLNEADLNFDIFLFFFFSLFAFYFRRRST